MDVYDHLPPTGMPVDSIYLLEARDPEGVSKGIWGTFDCLEAAMHSLQHASKYCLKMLERSGVTVFMVSRAGRNVVNMQRRNIISWHRDEGNGHFELHESGLRTHAVERV